jgi:hypothetical protein
MCACVVLELTQGRLAYALVWTAQRTEHARGGHCEPFQLLPLFQQRSQEVLLLCDVAIAEPQMFLSENICAQCEVEPWQENDKIYSHICEDSSRSHHAIAPLQDFKFGYEVVNLHELDML